MLFVGIDDLLGILVPGIPLSVLFLTTLERSVVLVGARLGLVGGHMLDGMGESPLLSGWASCPRCRHDLEHEERSVRCSSCGLTVYANPAPTASALLLDDEGRVLLARRAVDPGAGLWDLLGGFVEEGEEPRAALRREIEEETGLEIELGDFFGGYPDRYGDGIYTLNLYWTAGVAGGELTLDDELEEVEWFAAQELPPGNEFAFRNTVEVLEEWKRSLRPAEVEK